jgi:hypothetical protein
MKYVFIIITVVFTFGLSYGGMVTEISGKVDILSGDKWQKAVLAMEVKTGDRIMTGMNSSIRVETEGGFFEVKELSMVTFSEVRSSGLHDQKLTLDTGKVRVRFSKVIGVQSSFKVQTPRGTASVLGTEEEVGYSSLNGMSVYVIDGHIVAANNSGNSLGVDRGGHGGVSAKFILYGNFDYIYSESGGNAPFGDNDAENNTIKYGLKGYFNQLFFFQPPVPEPERL